MFKLVLSLHNENSVKVDEFKLDVALTEIGVLNKEDLIKLEKDIISAQNEVDWALSIVEREVEPSKDHLIRIKLSPSNLCAPKEIVFVDGFKVNKKLYNEETLDYSDLRRLSINLTSILSEIKLTNLI